MQEENNNEREEMIMKTKEELPDEDTLTISRSFSKCSGTARE